MIGKKKKNWIIEKPIFQTIIKIDNKIETGL